MPQHIASYECNYYLGQIEKDLESLYDVAGKARSKGLDPSLQPEPYVARDLAEMVEGLVGPADVAGRIRELIAIRKDKYEMAFIVASDIVHARFGHTEPEKAAEQAIRTALAIMTGGITAAPIQGLAHIKIKQNPDRTRYLAVYFAGPMRSAGGTEQALTLVVADYVRRLLGLGSYKPTVDEVRRFVEELRLYEREVSRFQYHVSDENVIFALQNLPVEATGTETDPVEVSSYRNLPRIETNRVRAGGLRVVNDGIVGRAQKVLKIVEENAIHGWDWLGRIKESSRSSSDADVAYMEDVIVGRPIFSFPKKAGSFRLRYGRSRNTGLAALGVHPATMAILQGFLASGTQIRIDGPGKGGVILPVDTVEPPIVKLEDGSVIRAETIQEASRIEGSVAKILFLGDLLVAFGEFLESNKPLLPSGYTEEWWAQELALGITSMYAGSKADTAHALGIEEHRLDEFLKNPLMARPTADETLRLSTTLGVPLHPHFTYFWRDLTPDELQVLKEECAHWRSTTDKMKADGLKLRLTPKMVEILDKLCVPYMAKGTFATFGEDELILRRLLCPEMTEGTPKYDRSIVDMLYSFSGLRVREKCLSTIGARMGRPEKARRRDMSPPVHALFPIGLAGGPHRNILLASRKGKISVEINRRRCLQCGGLTHKRACLTCGSPTSEEHVCPRCGHTIEQAICPSCNIPTAAWSSQEVDLEEECAQAVSRLGHQPLDQVKGVKSLMSVSKAPELLEKGFLRAKYGLSVFKDGTLRFDATNAPLTHFKPEEIEAPIERLLSLGYTHDIQGNELEAPFQMCELKVQDVVLPKKAAEYFLSACKFIDELLQKAYELPPFYKAISQMDLIGQLVLGFAPHTSAAVVGRVVGFSKANVCYGHPLWHNVKRRDCDGDEDSIMLLLDVLLNFSKAYLPSQIGGMMDAPLLIISAIDPFEVDEAQNMDVASLYPLDFYSQTLAHGDPKTVADMIDMVQHRLGTAAQFEGYSFTHHTHDINEGNLESSYMGLGSMANKLASQLDLAEKIRAVEAKEVARRVLNTHLMQDIMGNLRAYAGQKLRCKRCNAKYRRMPLSGKCWRCGGELLMTVHRKGVEKYLGLAEGIVKKYDLDPYYAQRVSLIQNEVECLFEAQTIACASEPSGAVATKGKQVKLGEFMQ